MTGEEVARQLISTLSVTYGIESSFIVAAMRDGASVNGVAMDVVKIVYPDIMDVRCFSHTLDLVGDKFKTPILASFCSYWISPFHRALRLKYFGRIKLVSLASYSKTRWWSKWEILHQIMLQFGDIEPFLTVNTDIGPSLRPKMLQNNSLEDYVESCNIITIKQFLQCNNYYIRYFVGIFGHNIGHYRAKTVAMPNSI